MGTLVEITLPADKLSMVGEINDRMTALSNIITTDCDKISAGNDVESSEITYRLIEKNKQHKEVTGNRFDIAAQTLASLYGFPDGEFREPTQAEIDGAVEAIATKEITLSTSDGRFYANAHGLKIDLGAYAKGWIVDNASNYLLSQGVTNFIINAGGDLFASGSKNNVKWRLGIADPDKKQAYISTVSLSDVALATSGTYERFFITPKGERISHIFDATTGKSASKYKSVSVIAKDTERADALSTIYFLLEEGEIARLCKADNAVVLIVTAKDVEKRYCGWERYEK
jgi:thiamine biosynthesis lipoprotein